MHIVKQNDQNVKQGFETHAWLEVIFTLGRPWTLKPEDGDTRVGLSQS